MMRLCPRFEGCVSNDRRRRVCGGAVIEAQGDCLLGVALKSTHSKCDKNVTFGQFMRGMCVSLQSADAYSAFKQASMA